MAWNHLPNLEFGDPEYGTPVLVDIHVHVHVPFGGKVFSKEASHHQRFRSTEPLSAFKMCFIWTLIGDMDRNGKHAPILVCVLPLETMHLKSLNGILPIGKSNGLIVNTVLLEPK